MPTAAVIVPTRDRPGYLEVTLASVAPQAAALGAEVIVVDDANAAAGRRLAQRYGARYLAHAAPRGPSAARNTGIAATQAPLAVVIDDDVQAPPSWLAALLRAAAVHPEFDVIGGPVHVRLERRRWRTCGVEPPPVSNLDLGPDDREVEAVLSANMLIRRSAFARAGPFSSELGLFSATEREHRIATARTGSAPEAGFYGEELEWQARLRAGGGRVGYAARAALLHRRAGRDATLPALMGMAFRRGRVARRWATSEHVDSAPRVRQELRWLAGYVKHALRHGCLNGVVSAAEVAGRLFETPAQLRERRRRPSTEDPPYLSGAAGMVARRRARLRAEARDTVLDAQALVARRGPRLARAAARRPPRRRILVAGVVVPDRANLAARAVAELRRTRHALTLVIEPAAPGLGKLQNLNRLLAGHDVGDHDWLLVVDDDVLLPAGFLDRFVFLCERFELDLAQPAQRVASHAAWPVTRRQARSVVRETRFVEIGPVTAFARRTVPVLLPFPELRFGWGLDAHWAAVARDHGWRVGIVDALPVTHRLRAIGAAYDHRAAAAEAERFLDGRPWLGRPELERTLVRHRGWGVERAR